jgi:hypothetical protein
VIVLRFLGYEFKELISFKKKTRYIGMQPSAKAVKKFKEEVHETTASNYGFLETSEMARRLNRKTRGWANYFDKGAVSKAYRGIAKHTLGRYRQWLKRKYKWSTKGYKSLNDTQMCDKFGLINILSLLPRFS